jgi:hypothetical protein
MNGRQDVNKRADIVESLLRLSTLQRFIARLCAPVSLVANRLRRLAKSAESDFGLGTQRRKKSAPVHIVAVGRSAELKPVYNLTVADAHLFYVEGVLSSNTDSEDHAPDEIRYACMSRPFVRQIEKKPTDKILGIGTHNQVTWNELIESQPTASRSGRI